MTAYSGLWDGVHGDTYALQVNRNPLNRQIGRALRKRGLTRLREVIDTVAAASSINGAAAVTYPRVEGTVDPGNSVVQGGSVAVETVTKIAAASSTTSADASAVDDIADFDTQPTYPTDASGNGGGSKLSGIAYT